jgi:chemotaxis protein CheX
MMASSLRNSLHVVTDPAHLTASVEEVFRLMLGVNCEQINGPLEKELDTITSVVGFGGVLSGACVFRAGETVARRIAGLLSGMELATLDDTVKDAIGEICNMLAGAWKGRMPELSANTMLSVPAVVTGRDYNVHVQRPEFRLDHIYSFEKKYAFEVTIICDGLQ